MSASMTLTLLHEMHHAPRSVSRRASRAVWLSEFRQALGLAILRPLVRVNVAIDNQLARRLERDAIFLKGLASAVCDVDVDRVLDPDGKVNTALNRSQASLQNLRKRQLEMQAEHGKILKLVPESGKSEARMIAVLADLYEAIDDLKWTIAEHDATAEQLKSGDRAPLLAGTPEEIERVLSQI